jgi:hypothetical protein
VRSEGSNDIVALRLPPAPPPRAERANDFRPVLSLLGVSAAPSDMALFNAQQGTRLLALSPASREAAVIDPATSRVTSFRLDSAADRLVMFEAASPAEPARRPRALLLAPGGAQVGFLDLDRLEELGARNLELRPMAASSSGRGNEFLPLVDRGLVVAHHGSGAADLNVIDLERRTVAPLVTEPLDGLAAGPSGSDELWLVARGSSRLGVLHLGRLAADEVRLDLGVQGVLPLPATAAGKRLVVVDHGLPGGGLTVLDADRPERKTARSLLGFMYTDVLQRGAP